MNSRLTYTMLQREAVRVACALGLELDYSNTKAFHFYYDAICNNEKFEYKGKKASYPRDSLFMCTDDFSDRIIRPLLLECLNNDLKFIHLDCT